MLKTGLAQTAVTNSWRWLVACLLALVLAAPQLLLAAGSSTIEHWLDRMSHASKALSYQGRFVYTRDGETSLLEIVHVVADNGSRERIVSLSGEAQELIRDQHGNVFLMNLGPPLLIDKGVRDVPLAVRLEQNLDRVLRNYTVELGERDRVAGRKTQVIDILPRDKQRYRYRLWVDLDTGFLTRSQLLSENGNVVEHIMFSDIELMDEPSEALLDAVLYGKDLVGASKNAVVTVSDDVHTEDLWQVSGKPLGFWRVDCEHSMALGAKKSVAYLMVTDGLASVSIYIEPLEDEEKALQGVSRSGALSAYGRILNRHQITVVGEVPPSTVKSIGDAVIQATMSLRTPEDQH